MRKWDPNVASARPSFATNCFRRCYYFLSSTAFIYFLASTTKLPLPPFWCSVYFHLGRTPTYRNRPFVNLPSTLFFWGMGGRGRKKGRLPITSVYQVPFECLCLLFSWRFWCEDSLNLWWPFPFDLPTFAVQWCNVLALWREDYKFDSDRGQWLGLHPNEADLVSQCRRIEIVRPTGSILVRLWSANETVPFHQRGKSWSQNHVWEGLGWWSSS